MLENNENFPKLSVKQKLTHLTLTLETIIKGIPVDDLETLVRRAADKVLTKESIRNICFEAEIFDEEIYIGNVHNRPYRCISVFTVRRIKKTLVRKTMEDFAPVLGKEVCLAVQKRITSIIDEVKKNVLKLDINLSRVTFARLEHIIVKLVIDIVYKIVNFILEAIDITVTAITTFVMTVDINSKDWRRKIADEIRSKLLENKTEIIHNILSTVEQICVNTRKDLTTRLAIINAKRKNIILPDQEDRTYKSHFYFFQNNIILFTANLYNLCITILQ